MSQDLCFEARLKRIPVIKAGRVAVARFYRDLRRISPSIARTIFVARKVTVLEMIEHQRQLDEKLANAAFYQWMHPEIGELRQ